MYHVVTIVVFLTSLYTHAMESNKVVPTHSMHDDNTLMSLCDNSKTIQNIFLLPTDQQESDYQQIAHNKKTLLIDALTLFNNVHNQNQLTLSDLYKYTSLLGLENTTLNSENIDETSLETFIAFLDYLDINPSAMATFTKGLYKADNLRVERNQTLWHLLCTHCMTKQRFTLSILGFEALLSKEEDCDYLHDALTENLLSVSIQANKRRLQDLTNKDICCICCNKVTLCNHRSAIATILDKPSISLKDIDALDNTIKSIIVCIAFCDDDTLVLMQHQSDNTLDSIFNNKKKKLYHFQASIY